MERLGTARTSPLCYVVWSMSLAVIVQYRTWCYHDTRRYVDLKLFCMIFWRIRFYNFISVVRKKKKSICLLTRSLSMTANSHLNALAARFLLLFPTIEAVCH